MLIINRLGGVRIVSDSIDVTELYYIVGCYGHLLPTNKLVSLKEFAELIPKQYLIETQKNEWAYHYLMEAQERYNQKQAKL